MGVGDGGAVEDVRRDSGVAGFGEFVALLPREAVDAEDVHGDDDARVRPGAVRQREVGVRRLAVDVDLGPLRGHALIVASRGADGKRGMGMGEG